MNRQSRLGFQCCFNLEIAYVQLNCPQARAEGVFILFYERPDVFCIQKILVKPDLSLNISHCDLCTKGRRRETLNMEFLLKICTLGNNVRSKSSQKFNWDFFPGGEEGN